MGLQQLNDRFYYLPHDTSNDRPILGYVRGDNFSIAIDAGNSKKHVDLFYSELDKHHLPRPTVTLITHWHWDHTFGMHAIDGLSIACRKTNEILSKVQQWKWDEESRQQRLKTGEEIQFCDKFMRVEYEDASDINVCLSDIEFEERLSIDCGGIDVIAQKIDSPHEDDCVLISIPSLKILFVADSDCGDFYRLGGAYDKDKLAKFIDMIESIDFEHYVLGHDILRDKEYALQFLNNEYSKLL